MKAEDLSNEMFLRGAIAAVGSDLAVDCVAHGNIESVIYTWYRVYDESSGKCAVALVDTDSEEGLQITDTDIFEWTGKVDFTERILASIRDHGTTGVWFVILTDGYANSTFLDETLLRVELEKGAAELECDFDFDEWAKGVGFK